MTNTKIKPKPVHAPNTLFSVEKKQLTINGKSMLHISEMVGQTPFYAYDKSIIASTVSALKHHLPSQIKLHYAVKANPFTPLLHFIAALVDGFDVASKGEMLQALQTSMPPHHISFAGPGKSTKELTSAIVSGITVNVESESELGRIEKLASELGIVANVAIRVNPAFELKSSGMKMTGGAKPFGIDSELVTVLIRYIERSDMHYRGLHIFSGSQNLSADALIDAHNNTFALAYELGQHSGVIAPSINIGGGLGIPYFPGEQPLDIEPICDNLARLCEDYQLLVTHSEIIMELGRYLVGPAGVYVSEVVDIKQSRGETFVVTNGGLHHHLANSGNFGQVIRKNYPVAVANKMLQANSEQVSIVGPLCTPLDILAHKVTLPKIALYDLIVIFQSGAYGACASPGQFLGHPSVAEILL